jgi:uncharacterized protein (TIGR03083 family)
MRIEHERAQDAFLEALRVFVGATNRLNDGKLLAPSRCRGWSVVDVVVHVHLGLQEMLLGIVAPTDEKPDTDAADYWRAATPGSGDQLAQIRFVRLVGAAYHRPTGAVAHLRPTAEGVAVAVDALKPGVVRFQGHIMTTGDFLATWAVELAVHQLDLAAELKLEPPAPDALAIARETIETLAGGPLPTIWPDDVAVLLGSGRIRLTSSQWQEAGPLAEQLPVLG